MHYPLMHLVVMAKKKNLLKKESKGLRALVWARELLAGEVKRLENRQRGSFQESDVFTAALVAYLSLPEETRETMAGCASHFSRITSAGEYDQKNDDMVLHQLSAAMQGYIAPVLRGKPQKLPKAPSGKASE